MSFCCGTSLLLSQLLQLGIHVRKSLLNRGEGAAHQRHQDPEKVLPMHKPDLAGAQLLDDVIVLACRSCQVTNGPSQQSQVTAGSSQGNPRRERQLNVHCQWAGTWHDLPRLSSNSPV